MLQMVMVSEESGTLERMLGEVDRMYHHEVEVALGSMSQQIGLVSQASAGLPGALAGYTVTLRCHAGPPRVEDGVTRCTYTLSATACSVPAGGVCPSGSTAAGYVQAVAAAQVTRP
jgi:hypothetical protein